MDLRSRFGEGAALAALLGAGAWLVLALADLHVLGLTRDDGEFVAYARAIGAGLGYVDPADPALPPAARYPIGFPALLAGVLTGAADWSAQLARLQAVSALALVAYLGLAHVALRRLGGLAAPWALGGTALLACDPDVLGMAAWVNSDLPFAAIALAAVLALEGPLRAPPGEEAPAWRWLAGGLLVAAACLVRSAGLALVAGLAFAALRHGKGRAAWPAAAPIVLALGGWAAYRARLGGQAYAEVFAQTAPADPLALAATAAQVAAKLLGTAVPELLAPGLLEGGGPLVALVGVVVAAVAIGGLGAWAWRAGTPAAPLPGAALAPAYALATLAMAAAWTLGFVRLEENLLTRLAIPVAPFLLLGAVAGGPGLLRLAGAPAGFRAGRLGRGALAVALAGAAWSLQEPFAHLAQAPRLRAEQAAWQALFEAIRAQTPEGAVVVSRYHEVVWLHAGRRGRTWPVAFRDGAVRAIGPAEGLAFLAASGATHVAATPSEPGVSAETRDVLNPILRDRPGVLVPAWVGAGGQYALFAVDREALKAATR